MATDVDRNEIMSALQGAADGVREAAALGKELSKDVDKIFFVACGAPNRSMQILKYWINYFNSSLEVRCYFPAEFMAQNPVGLDERTLVVLGSKSGTTIETVGAAEFLMDKPGLTVGFTTTAEKPLAKAVKELILTGEDEKYIVGLPHASLGIAMMAFIGGLLAGKGNWPLEEKLLRSLEALPSAVADTKIGNEARATEEARLYKDDRTIYQIASGPMFSTAYVFGVCTLMEMQWMNSTPLEAAEFFHGPFEIVDQNTPLILLIGEDPSRPLMERVELFCKRYTERLIIYDSRDFEMKGIDPEIRAMVAPYIVGTALDRIGEKLAVWHNHPLETRRYMGKVAY